jgi:hypothetical protein
LKPVLVSACHELLDIERRIVACTHSASCLLLVFIEAIKRATVYLSIANYVSKQLDDAFYKCENRNGCTGSKCDINDVRMMEGGLAFYAGSLEGQGTC